MEKVNVNTHISNGNPECTQFADNFDIFYQQSQGFSMQRQSENNLYSYAGHKCIKMHFNNE